MNAKVSARLRADLSLLLVSAIWGGTFVMVKDALQDVGPLTFLALRFSLAALLLATLVARRRRPASAALVRAGFLTGCLLFAGYALQTMGLQFTTAGKAGFITGLSVAIVPVLSALWLQRPPARLAALGIGLAVSGLALLSLGDPEAVVVGDLLVLGCAVAFALHILVVERFAPRFHPLPFTAAQVVAAALLTTLGALATESPTPAQLLAALPAAAFTGLFATVAAFYIQTHAQRFTTAIHTALIFSAEPVFAVLFASLLAGEQLTPRAVAGCLLILAGMLLAQLAPEP